MQEHIFIEMIKSYPSVIDCFSHDVIGNRDELSEIVVEECS